MGFQILGADGTPLKVDATSNAARATLYAPDGTVLTRQDRSAITPGSSSGMPLVGRDGPLARLLRCSPDGMLKAGDDYLVFYDSTEGAAVDTNKWVQTVATMTITQAAGTGILLNAGSSAANAAGAMQLSHTRFPNIGRNSLAARYKVRYSAHFNNNVLELGFGSPASSTATTIVDGACWRKNGSGQWIPIVVASSGTDVTGDPVDDATFRAAVGVTEYAIFAVFVEETRATFRITKADGTLVNEQIVNFGPTIGTFGTTHLQAMIRNYNAAATGTAVQMWVAQASVWLTDMVGPPLEQALLWMNNGSLTSPTAYTQLANYSNGAAPATATLSNITAGYTTLGGQWQFAAVAGAETDYAFFGIQIPAPYGFTATRVAIDAINTGAAVATTATVLQWGLAFNSSAVSLATGAPYPPMRKTIGVHTFAVGAAIGASGGPSVVWQGREKVQPGRFFHVTLKMPIATATASQILRGTCAVEGFFE